MICPSDWSSKRCRLRYRRLRARECKSSTDFLRRNTFLHTTPARPRHEPPPPPPPSCSPSCFREQPPAAFAGIDHHGNTRASTVAVSVRTCRDLVADFFNRDPLLISALPDEEQSKRNQERADENRKPEENQTGRALTPFERLLALGANNPTAGDQETSPSFDQEGGGGGCPVSTEVSALGGESLTSDAFLRSVLEFAGATRKLMSIL